MTDLNSAKGPGSGFSGEGDEIPSIEEKNWEDRIHEAITMVKTLSTYIQKLYSALLTAKYSMKEAIAY